MTRFRFLPIVLGLSMIVAGAARADDQDIVDYPSPRHANDGRRSRCHRPDPEEQGACGKLRDARQGSCRDGADGEEAFEPEVPSTHAEPEIWAKGSDFAKRLWMSFRHPLQELAKAAEAERRHRSRFEGAGGADVQSCHDVYRRAEDLERVNLVRYATKGLWRWPTDVAPGSGSTRAGWALKRSGVFVSSHNADAPPRRSHVS